MIHMEIGEPDLLTPQPVIDAAAVVTGEWPDSYYTSVRFGIRAALREAISGHYRACIGLRHCAGAHHRHRWRLRGATAHCALPGRDDETCSRTLLPPAIAISCG